jgi:hypothetical protein
MPIFTISSTIFPSYYHPYIIPPSEISLSLSLPTIFLSVYFSLCLSSLYYHSPLLSFLYGFSVLLPFYCPCSLCIIHLLFLLYYHLYIPLFYLYPFQKFHSISNPSHFILPYILPTSTTLLILFLPLLSLSPFIPLSIHLSLYYPLSLFIFSLLSLHSVISPSIIPLSIISSLY